MSLILLLCSYFQPDVNNLGLDSYRAREWWHEKYDNPLSAFLLPLKQSEDPEVRYRVAAIRTKNLKWLNPVYWERVSHNRNFAAWVKTFVLDGDSLDRCPEEIFFELHTSTEKADAFFKLAPAPGQEWFLRGMIANGEYTMYRDHIQHYRNKVK